MSRLIVGLDTETTDVDPAKGARVIELCCMVFRLSDRAKLSIPGFPETQRFNPEGATMNKKAQAVHGIASHELVGKPTFKSFAPKLQLLLSRKPIVVAHNAAFDMKFLAWEMAKAGCDLPMDLTIIDTMTDGMTASYDNKYPSLREFCWAMSVEYDESKAHAADYDVRVMMDSFFRAVDYGYITIPDLEMEQTA